MCVCVCVYVDPLLLKWTKSDFRVLRKMDLKFLVGVQIVGNNLWNNRLILGTVVMSIVDLHKCLLHILMNFEEKRDFYNVSSNELSRTSVIYAVKVNQVYLIHLWPERLAVIGSGTSESTRDDPVFF